MMPWLPSVVPVTTPPFHTWIWLKPDATVPLANPETTTVPKLALVALAVRPDRIRSSPWEITLTLVTVLPDVTLRMLPLPETVVIYALCRCCSEQNLPTAGISRNPSALTDACLNSLHRERRKQP